MGNKWFYIKSKLRPFDKLYHQIRVSFITPRAERNEAREVLKIKAKFLSKGSENSENQKKDGLAEKLTKKYHDLALTLIVSISGYKPQRKCQVKLKLGL